MTTTGKLGYDIESLVRLIERLRFVEIEVRVAGADVLMVKCPEFLCSLKRHDDFILGLVEFQR